MVIVHKVLVAVSLTVLIAATLTEGCWTRQDLTLQSAHAQAVQDAAYVVFIDVADGNKIKARNGITGEVEYYGADAAAVLQNAIDALASTGGSILLTQGTYVWQSVPGLPKDLPNWLKIVGDGDVTIQLTTNGPRAFDFRKRADYDTFRSIWLEGFTVDCNNIGGKHHVVLGTYISGTAQTRINMQNIVIRNITTKNVPVDSTETNHRLNVWIVVRHPAAGETETVIKDILVEHCDFQGGNMGVVIGGSGPVAVNLKVFLDGIQIHNCRHSLLSVQSSLFSSANFFVGSRGYGGSVHISDCYGEYSGDVGVEVNAMTHVLVENCQMIDAVAAGYYHVNYNNPAKADEQTVTFRNCVARRLKLGTSLAGMGFSVLDSLSVPLGNLVFDNCSFYGVTNKLQEGNCISIAPTSNVRSVSLLNCRCDVENFVFNQAGNAGVSAVYLNFAGTTATNLQIKGLQTKIRGSRAGAGEFYVAGLHLNGKVKMSLEDISTDMSTTDSTPGGLLGLVLGDLASTIDGSILRYKPTFAVDTYPSGIRVGGTGTLTISNQLRIENCDFTAMTGGTEFYFGSPSNSGKVTLLGNKWKSFSAARFASGPQVVGIAGESLVYGSFCCLKSDGKYWKSDADQASTMPIAAMALGTISANAEGIFLLSEVAHDDSWSWTVGGTLYASTSASELTQTVPSGTGVQVQAVGIAKLATEILFNPSTPATTITLATTTLATTSSTATSSASTSVFTYAWSTLTAATTSYSTSHQTTTRTLSSGTVPTTYTSRETLYSIMTSSSAKTSTSTGIYASTTTQLSKTGTATLVQTSTFLATSGNTVLRNIIVQNTFIEQFLERIVSTVTEWISELTQIFQNVFLTETVRDTVVRVEPITNSFSSTTVTPTSSTSTTTSSTSISSTSTSTFTSQHPTTTTTSTLSSASTTASSSSTSTTFSSMTTTSSFTTPTTTSTTSSTTTTRSSTTSSSTTATSSFTTTLTKLTTTSATTSSTRTSYASTSVFTSQRFNTTTAAVLESTLYQTSTTTRFSGSVSTTYTSRTTSYATSTSLSTATLTSTETRTSVATELSKTGTATVARTSTSIATSGNTVYANIIVQNTFIEQFVQRIISTFTYWTSELAQIVKNVFVTGTVRDTVVKVEPTTSASTLGFSLSSSGGIAVTQGGSASNTIMVTLTGGTSQIVTLSASGLPSGASASFNPASGSPTFTSTCTISTSSSTPTGVYTITVTGTGGGLARTTTFTLEVNSRGEVGKTRIVLDASPKSGYVNKPVTISGVMYGSWRRIKGAVVGAPVEIATSWGFGTSVVTDDQGQFSVTTTCPSTGGTYQITAKFYEDEYLTGASETITYQVIAKIETSITISFVGNREFAGYLTRKDTGAYLANKPVKLTVHYLSGGTWQTTTYDLRTRHDGYWNLEFLLFWNSATISFEGDETYAPTSAQITR